MSRRSKENTVRFVLVWILASCHFCVGENYNQVCVVSSSISPRSLYNNNDDDDNVDDDNNNGNVLVVGGIIDIHYIKIFQLLLIHTYGTECGNDPGVVVSLFLPRASLIIDIKCEPLLAGNLRPSIVDPVYACKAHLNIYLLGKCAIKI